MRPTIGRIVIFTTDPSAESWRRGTTATLPEEQWPALIIKVTPLPEKSEKLMVEEQVYIVDLFVFTEAGSFYAQDAKFSEKPSPRTWSWPPRVNP